VRYNTHMIVLSDGFCRRVTDWSIYYTFMLTPDPTTKESLLDLPRDD